MAEVHLKLEVKWWSARAIAVIAACLLMTACGQKRVLTLEAAPPDLFDWSKPITVSSSYAVADRHGRIVAGAAEGLGTGMAQGALGSVAGGAQTGDPLGLALGIVLAPVFAVGGGVYGASAAHSTDEANAAITAIEKLYDDSLVLSALGKLIEKRIAGLGFPEKPASYNTAAVNPSEMREITRKPKNKLILHTTYSFRTAGVYSPDLQFKIDLSATAAHAEPNKPALDYRWLYVSPKLDFFSATANEATNLRQHLADSQKRLADAIVHDPFTARRQVRVTGTYFPNRDGENFVPHGLPLGKISRVPTQSELINVPEHVVEEHPTKGDNVRQTLSTNDKLFSGIQVQTKEQSSKKSAIQKANLDSSAAVPEKSEIKDGEMSINQIKSLFKGITLVSERSTEIEGRQISGPGSDCYIYHHFQSSDRLETTCLHSYGHAKQEGKWWTEKHNVLCMKWQTWFDGKRHCYSVIKNTDQIILLENRSQPTVYKIENH